MKITVEIPFAIDNPLPDFPAQRYVKQIEAEISDEDIQRLGRRYFELASNPVNNMTFERVEEK